MSNTTENSLVPSEADSAATIEKARKLNAQIVELTRVAYDPAEKLERDVKLGLKFIERCRFQRDNTKDWNNRAYSAMAKDREEEIRLILGVNEARLDVAAKVAMFVDLVKVQNPLVEKISYHRIANHFIPMIEWDGASLEASIKEEWRDWINNNIADNARTKEQKPIPMAELLNKLDTEKARQKDSADRLAGAQPATTGPDDKAGQWAERTDKANKKREATKAAKARQDARDTFTTGYESVTRDGGYTKAELVEHFALAADFAEISESFINVKGLDVNGAVAMMKALYAAGKMAEIKAIVSAGSKMIENMVEAMKSAA